MLWPLLLLLTAAATGGAAWGAMPHGAAVAAGAAGAAWLLEIGRAHV